jgi:hypothetical protein
MGDVVENFVRHGLATRNRVATLLAVEQVYVSGGNGGG